MPVYTIKPADKDMPTDEVAVIVRDFDSTINIVNEDGTHVEAEMTEQQMGDFLATYQGWQADKIVYADINKPAPNLDNLRKALQRSGPQPS